MNKERRKQIEDIAEQISYGKGLQWLTHTSKSNKLERQPICAVGAAACLSKVRESMRSNCIARRLVAACRKPAERWASKSRKGLEMTLHQQIMNLPCDDQQDGIDVEDALRSYRQGHRDARHAAAELASAADAEIERLRDALHEIRMWAQAYPLEVFPEPDMKKAHEALKAAGMTLDGISASNMRHVLKGVMGIVDKALPQEQSQTAI